MKQNKTKQNKTKIIGFLFGLVFLFISNISSADIIQPNYYVDLNIPDQQNDVYLNLGNGFSGTLNSFNVHISAENIQLYTHLTMLFVECDTNEYNGSCGNPLLTNYYFDSSATSNIYVGKNFYTIDVKANHPNGTGYNQVLNYNMSVDKYYFLSIIPQAQGGGVPKIYGYNGIPYLTMNGIAYTGSLNILVPPPFDDNYESCGDFDLFCHLRNAFKWAFHVEQSTFDLFSDLKDELSTRAPFGYISGIYNAINGITNDTENRVFTLESVGKINDLIFIPFRTALSWLLYFAFAFALFHRFKDINI